MGAPRKDYEVARFIDSIVEIPLPSEPITVIDIDDWPLVSEHRWRARVTRWTVYVQAHIRQANKRIEVDMHRLIMGEPSGMQVDHADHNGLNNRRKNLRVATCVQNRGNTLIQPNNTSGYKGVSWHKHTEKWRAYISRDSVTKHLGLFIDPWDAAQAYNVVALERWGEFALLNTRGGESNRH